MHRGIRSPAEVGLWGIGAIMREGLMHKPPLITKWAVPYGGRQDARLEPKYKVRGLCCCFMEPYYKKGTCVLLLPLTSVVRKGAVCYCFISLQVYREVCAVLPGLAAGVKPC
jgi:hypothetical protein